MTDPEQIISALGGKCFWLRETMQLFLNYAPGSVEIPFDVYLQFKKAFPEIYVWMVNFRAPLPVHLYNPEMDYVVVRSGGEFGRGYFFWRPHEKKEAEAAQG